MTGQHIAWLLLGVASGVASGYPWGRVQLRRAKFREFAPRLREALRRAYDRGYDWGREDGYADALDDLDAWPKDGEAVMPNDPGRNAQGRPGPLVAPGPPLSLAGGGPGLDWRERTAIELAPETLAAACCIRCQRLDPADPCQGCYCHDDLEGSAALQPDERRDVPRARTGGRPVTPEQPGPGHRGVSGWTTDPRDLVDGHWKPNGDRWVAEWRIEWQDDVAAIDEEIAAWSERAWAWLESDPWDRSARRLERA